MKYETALKKLNSIGKTYKEGSSVCFKKGNKVISIMKSNDSCQSAVINVYQYSPSTYDDGKSFINILNLKQAIKFLG